MALSITLLDLIFRTDLILNGPNLALKQSAEKREKKEKTSDFFANSTINQIYVLGYQLPMAIYNGTLIV